MSQATLHLLGSPRIESDGEEVRVSRRKAFALLAYLAVTGQSHTRDALVTPFWPEQDQSRARNSLRGALGGLGHALVGVEDAISVRGTFDQGLEICAARASQLDDAKLERSFLHSGLVRELREACVALDSMS